MPVPRKKHAANGNRQVSTSLHTDTVVEAEFSEHAGGKWCTAVVIEQEPCQALSNAAMV